MDVKLIVTVENLITLHTLVMVNVKVIEVPMVFGSIVKLVFKFDALENVPLGAVHKTVCCPCAAPERLMVLPLQAV